MSPFFSSVPSTHHASLDDFVRSIANKNERVDYRVADFTSEEGRLFPYVYISANSQASGDEENRKLRVWIQGGVHGNEPAGDQAVLALLGKLDADETWTTSLLQKMDIILLPRYNPDGVAYFQRELASNLDPNREHTKLARQQSRGIKQLMSSFSPHIVVDMHEFTGTRLTDGRYKHGSKSNTDSIAAVLPPLTNTAVDALIAPGKNLNTHVNIRNISEVLFASGIAKRLETAGFRWESYFTAASSDSPGITLGEAGSDAKAGRNNFGLMQSIVILNEVRGIRLADQHFQRRVATALTMVSAILDIALENFDDVYSTVSVHLILTARNTYSSRTG